VFIINQEPLMPKPSEANIRQGWSISFWRSWKKNKEAYRNQQKPVQYNHQHHWYHNLVLYPQESVAAQP
jgi:hypothetical protein